MKAHVEPGCISCGLCISICPNVFHFNEENLAEAADTVPDADRAAVQEAADSCPVSVIAVTN